MPRFYYLLFTSCILSLFVLSCKSTQSVAQQSEAPELDHSLLWKIEKTGQAPSYLFGTIHLIEADDFILTDESRQALSQSDELVMELDMMKMEDPMVMMEVLSKANMVGGVSLPDLLNEEDMSLVDNYFTSMGIPMMFMGQIKPMFLTMLVDMDFQDVTSSEYKSYEIELTALAHEQNKAISGLETVDYQLGLFDSIPYEDQAKMLVEAIKNKDSGNEGLEELISAYLSEDLDRMANMMADTDPLVARYADLLLIQRNQDWLPKIESLTKQKTAFIAVGAGHLGGDHGLIRLLRQKGYTVTPLHTQPK